LTANIASLSANQRRLVSLAFKFGRAARVVEIKTMIRVHLPTACPAQYIFHYALGRIPRLDIPRFVT